VVSAGASRAQDLFQLLAYFLVLYEVTRSAELGLYYRLDEVRVVFEVAA